MDRAVEGVRSWDDVKVLSVQVDRVNRWHAHGLLLIGDAAHAMSPIGGVGINLAVQDAAAAARLLAPALLDGRVSSACWPESSDVGCCQPSSRSACNGASRTASSTASWLGASRPHAWSPLLAAALTRPPGAAGASHRPRHPSRARPFCSSPASVRVRRGGRHHERHAHVRGGAWRRPWRLPLRNPSSRRPDIRTASSSTIRRIAAVIGLLEARTEVSGPSQPSVRP